MRRRTRERKPPGACAARAAQARRGMAAGGQGAAGRPAPRRIPRLRGRLDVALAQRAVAWVTGLLLRRHGLSARQAASRAGLGAQTVREYLRLAHPGAWFTAAALAHALGRHPDALEALARRWIGKYIRRETAAHQGQRGWALALPWDKPAADVKHE